MSYHIPVTVGQINTTPGDFIGNKNKILEAVKTGISNGSRMVVLPELSIPGYLSADLMYHNNYIDLNLQTLHNIAEETKDTDIYIVVGYIGRNLKGTGKPFTNMLAVIKSGAIIGTYQKRLLPFYDVFDEGRYFEPGNSTLVLEIDGAKVGFCICEDVWNDKGSDGYNYEDNPASIYRDKLRVDLLVNISSSPYTRYKPIKRISMLEQVCRPDMSMIYVNQVGGQDELIFDGNSCYIYRGSVSQVAQGPTEQHIKFDAGIHDIAFTSDNLRKFVEDEYLIDILALGIKDYVHKNGFKEVVLGSSGGIDSAVVAALACKALGPDNVHAIMMPSIYSSEGSVNDAKKLHKKFGCKEYIIPISHEEMVQHINGNTDDLVGRNYNLVADENIQARIRGMAIMHISNSRGFLPLATGNKTEYATGYSTLYGDSCGGFCPIKDLYKMEVYSIARTLGVPSEIVDKAPSAELSPDQTDENSLLPYPILDNIVKGYIEFYIDDLEDFKANYAKKMSNAITPSNKRFEKFTVNDFSADFAIQNLKRIFQFDSKKLLELDKNHYDRIIKLIYINEFKRRQSAPGIKISERAFGTGRRLPITANYKYLS